MEPASRVYRQIITYSQAVTEGKDTENMEVPDMNEALDTLIGWFCLLFHNQFTVDDMLDNYSVDRLVHDIAFALMAVQSQTTEILSDFPTKPVQTKKTETKENQKGI